MRELDLSRIEKDVWASFFQDGLVDIMMGLFLVTPGIRILTDNVWFTFGFMLAVPVMIFGKWLTASRLGKVRFGPERTQKLMRGSLVFAFILLLVLTVWVIILGDVVDTPEVVPAIILALGIMALYSTLARCLDLRRFHLYGALLGTGMALLAMDYEPAGPIALVCAGAIVLAVGISRFVRFLRKYPRPSPEEMDHHD